MPLAMHCKVMGLYLTTALSESPEDLIVGGTRFKKKRGEERKEGRKKEVREGTKTIISGIKHLKVCIQELETSKFSNPNPNPKLPLTASATNRFPKH